MTSSSKRRYVVPSASPPTTSDSSGSASSSSDDNESNNTPSIKKKRRCTRNKPNYNESSSKPNFRESYVFSTALANLAAGAVKQRMCDSIIIYHKGIPREPNRLTIKPPKVTSKLLATSSVKNRKREKEQEHVHMQIQRENERKRNVKPKTKPVKPTPKIESVPVVKCTKTSNGSLKSPLTPPRSPSSLPLSAGDYSLSVSERIKCRARACAPKFYGEAKDETAEAEPSPGSSAGSVMRSPEKERGSAVTPGATPVSLPRESRRRSAEKPRRASTERLRERRPRRDSIESDGEKIRNILENSEKGIKPEQTAVTSPVESKPKSSSSREFPKPKELPPKSLKSPKIAKPELKSVSPKLKEESKTAVSVPKTVPASSPKPPTKVPTKPSPSKSEKPKPRLSDSGGLFEAAMSQKIRSPVRLKKQISSETKTETPEKSSESPVTPTTSVSSAVSKFKPVKQSSPSKETPATPTSESQDPNLPKFKPLPFSGNTKKSKTFKFRTPQGVKHEMNLVDSIFSNDANSTNPPELPPRINKPPTTTPVTTPKIPVTKLSDKPPRPELVMGIPNLQGPSKPPMLTPAHNSIFQHGSLQHIIRTGPPPLSSPKIAVTTKCNQPGPPANNISPTTVVNVAPKRASNEHHPASGEQRKKKRFAFPEEATSPVKVTSPISPSSPVTLKGPGSSRVSPISPIQTSVDNILTTPILRNGLPLHKPSPKNSPQNRRLDLRAEFSGRRSPLVKVTNNTSPITPKASPSTVGQFYQPNVSVSLNSCSRSDLNLSDSVLEHSKVSGQIVNRTPVVTINHQTVTMDQERGKEAPKPRLTVESDSFSKKQQQEIFARQQLYSRAFSPFSLPNSIPTTAAGKFNKQIELTQQLMQHELGSLVDLHGRGEKEAHSQPAFPTAATQLRQQPNNIQSARQGPRQPSPRQRTLPTELLMQQNRDRLLSQQQERLLAQQRQHAATSASRDHNVHSPLFAQRQESLLHRPPAGTPNQHLQHIPYGGGVLNQIGYPIGLNPQLYKQLATDPALTQVTSASLLQSLAGYHQQLQLAAAAAGKFGPLAHLYQSNSKPSDDNKTPNQFGVIRP